MFLPCCFPKVSWRPDSFELSWCIFLLQRSFQIVFAAANVYSHMFEHFLRIYKENESLDLDALQGQDQGNVQYISINTVRAFCKFLCFFSLFWKDKGFICQIVGHLKTAHACVHWVYGWNMTNVLPHNMLFNIYLTFALVLLVLSWPAAFF